MLMIIIGKDPYSGLIRKVSMAVNLLHNWMSIHRINHVLHKQQRNEARIFVTDLVSK